jgi:poly(U)-binding-splicing factor PUF60
MAKDGASASAAGGGASTSGRDYRNRIYVGSLHYELREPDLRGVFSAFGTIVDLTMPMEGPKSKGYCFVE